MLKKFIEKFKIDTIPDPPYTYDFLLTLSEKDYPAYLKKIFFYITGEKLNLKNPSTFNEKIQWIKLFDNSPLKTQLTDKVLVRDWVKDKIGQEYLKPVLQICPDFDSINFDSLPDKFIIKCNHGCKWQYKIFDKNKFLATQDLFNLIKHKFDYWMNQSFSFWAGFELQYKDIKPQILIEPLLIDNYKNSPNEFEIYSFNSQPKIFQKIVFGNPTNVSVYNQNYENINLLFNSNYNATNESAPLNLKKAVELSKILANDFKLVRIDWLEYDNKIYFNEMTFSPFSGFFFFADKETNLNLGKMLNLKN